MLREFAALTRREFIKLARNPQAIFTSLLLPLLYLLLFGQGFNINPTQYVPAGTPPSVVQGILDAYFRGAPNYYSYFTAGMVGFVAVTSTLFLGANVIFDKLFGVFKRTRGTPAPPPPSSARASSRVRPSRSCSPSSSSVSPSSSSKSPGSTGSISPRPLGPSAWSRSCSRSSCSPSCSRPCS